MGVFSSSFLFGKMKNAIEVTNTFLILLSLLLAYIFPFELFIIAYAVLGPLHYLTEINWIRDKSYFVKNKYWAFITVLLSFFIALPVILKLDWFEFSDNTVFYFIKNEFVKYTNGFIFLALVLAFVFLFIKQKRLRYIVICSSVIIALLINSLSVYNIWIGIFLPTIIHVYLFTLFFMWFGSIKAKEKHGYFNTFLLALVPFIIVFVSIDGFNYQFSPYIKEVILNNRFHVLNTSISNILGLSDGSTFFFYETIDLKIQVMIAFAYTYHYLNWFSKTTIIGWHKKLSSKKSIIILLLWVGALFLYYFDYKIGLSLLLVLSLIHVFLEFPINFLSIKGIYKHIVKSF